MVGTSNGIAADAGITSLIIFTLGSTSPDCQCAQFARRRVFQTVINATDGRGDCLISTQSRLGYEIHPGDSPWLQSTLCHQSRRRQRIDDMYSETGMAIMKCLATRQSLSL
jgi:hypothetical protein